MPKRNQDVDLNRVNIFLIQLFVIFKNCIFISFEYKRRFEKVTAQFEYMAKNIK